MKLPLIRISSTTFTLLLAAYFTFGLNFVIAAKLLKIFRETADITIPLMLTVPVFFIAALAFVFAPFVSKHVAKPVFILLLLSSACVNYGAYNFGVIFNHDMMTNIFDTTSAEAASYANSKLWVWIFLSGVVPALLTAFVKIEYKPFAKEVLRKAVLMLAALGVILTVAAVYYKDYASVARNNPKMEKDIVPTYYVASAFKYLKRTYFTPVMPYREMGTDAKRIRTEKSERYLVVFLVGETARAQNYQLNGYPRETNAYTKGIPNLVSFRDVTSCGTATAISLPCMFSLFGRKDYSLEKAESQDNAIDIINRAKFRTVWLDNNTGCKGVCERVENYSTTKLPQLKCVGEECNDDVLLDVLDKTIDNIKDEDGIVFLHLMGSHGPTYYKRYSEQQAKFKPDCQTSDLQSCTDEQIINTYDNTILFTDYVMAKVIDRLKKHGGIHHTALVYISDHGESLGEKGLYLHGMPYPIAPKQQKHVPFIVWLSDDMVKHKGMDMTCLKKVAETGSFSHENLSATLLHLMDVRTNAYDPNKDVFAPCEKVKW